MTGSDLKGCKVLFPFKYDTFKRTISIHNNSSYDSDVELEAAIRIQEATDAYCYPERSKKKFIYGTNVEEFAADYYCSHLIANSPNDSVQTALPHQLQQHKGAQSAVIKCKVIKENETTWVAAFSEGKLWTDVMKY